MPVVQHSAPNTPNLDLKGEAAAHLPIIIPVKKKSMTIGIQSLNTIKKESIKSFLQLLLTKPA